MTSQLQFALQFLNVTHFKNELTCRARYVQVPPVVIVDLEHEAAQRDVNVHDRERATRDDSATDYLRSSRDVTVERTLDSKK